MTVSSLIKLLQTCPQDMLVIISIPEVILDDGYVESYKTCTVNDVWLRKDMPVVAIDYDYNSPIEVI